MVIGGKTLQSSDQILQSNILKILNGIMKFVFPVRLRGSHCSHFEVFASILSWKRITSLQYVEGILALRGIWYTYGNTLDFVSIL